MKTQDIKMFQHIVESGSLVKAADLLDLPKSNLSRRLKVLEQALGIDLFHRQHKTMVLSDHGRRFYQASKTFIDQLESEIQGMSSDCCSLSGHIRVQILALPNNQSFANIIADFMRLHPKVTIEIISSSTEFDLIANNVDIGFRIGSQLESVDLIARKLATVDLSFFASPEYLKQHGTPKTASELADHEFILFRKFNGKVDNKMVIDGQEISISGRLTLNDMLLMKQSCLDHQGIVFMADIALEEDLKQGRVIKLLPAITNNQGHGWLLYPRRKTLSAQSKALINYIIERFKV